MSVLETILTVAAGLFGGLNVLQFVFLRQTKRKYEAEANAAMLDVNKSDANAYIETAAAQFVLLKDVTEFLQNQLKEKEERFEEQTGHVRELNKQLLDAQNETAKARIEAMEMRCEVQKCPNRKPPTGY